MSSPRSAIYETVETNSLLSALAWITLLCGLVSVAYLVYMAGTIHNLRSYQSWGSERVDPMLMAAAIGVLFQSVVGYAALKGLADAISILKFVGAKVDDRLHASPASPSPVLDPEFSQQGSVPEGYMLASEYAQKNGVAVERVIRAISNKEVVGGIINGKWHILDSTTVPGAGPREVLRSSEGKSDTMGIIIGLILFAIFVAMVAIMVV